MNIEKINKILENLPFNPDLTYYSQEEDGKDEEIFYKIYSIKGEEDIFLKIKYMNDSYGENDMIRGLQFVKPIEKIITSFEPLK